MILLSIIWIDLIGLTSSLPNSFLQGNKITCNEEGKIVTIPFLKSDPCITCMCINNEIDCFKNTCSQTINCYHYHQSNHSTNQCCRECLHCRIDSLDRVLQNGETFVDPIDPCRQLYCHSGTLTIVKTECYVPCEKPYRLMGQCCPSCNACPRNVHDGDEIAHYSNDTCIRCYCFKGQVICHRRICPVLPCPVSKQIRSKNSCCPRCSISSQDEIRSNSFAKNSCVFGEKIYHHLEQFKADDCTKCECKNSTNHCQREICPPLSCPPSERISKRGECCPRCQSPRVKKEMETDCIYKQIHLRDGDWTDSCRCRCVHGKIDCNHNQCPRDFVCPLGHKKVRIDGECCESCVPDDGKCRIIDSMTNITTYDGHNYFLNGQCNYILSKDCESNRFSVHLLNKFHNATRNFGENFRTISLMIRLESTKIMLNPRGKIRRNQSFEISLKDHFRERTCGLCGNFNSDSNDEFQTRNSKRLVRLEQFLDSFQVGKNIFCPKIRSNLRDNEKLKQIQICPEVVDQQTINRTIRICNRTRKRIGYCGIDDLAYQQCLDDMCQCHNNKQCQCYAIERYFKSCSESNRRNSSESNRRAFHLPSICKSYECPPGSEFIFCSFECKKTCQNYAMLEQNDPKARPAMRNQCKLEQCRSDCECIGNRVWHKGQCIPDFMCPQ
ncbi:BMP-binding endothelial regulator protein [Sarcoptes scabiei]|uniref:BMP-binding endothelial regulator protein n=1 Tax=Sarcoptes scabiei TaxID=52283 RepID=A0A834VAB8_SARSC|nr:BMP-binding endothelial regulator protein [Sarcoptes scabiei]